MPTWVLPSDSHVVNDTGHTTDHNHVADDLTLINTSLPIVSGGLTGAVQAARFAGATTSGAPGSGTFAVGDYVVDRTNGTIWLCTAAGSPGTWAALLNTSAAQTITAEKIIQVASGTTGLLVSTDGTQTSFAAVYVVPGNGIGIYDSVHGTVVNLVPDISVGVVGAGPGMGGAFGTAMGAFGSTAALGDPAFVVLNFAQSAPGLGQAELTVYDDGHVVTFNNTLDDGSGNAAFAGTVTLAAGTTSKAPAKFQSGTSLTTAAAGAAEFDGTALYFTAAASSRQVVDAEQFQSLTTARTFTNNTSAQAIFNATANGAVTLAASTAYDFECLLNVTGLSSSSHTVNFGFGGTATYTSAAYQALTATAAGGALSSFAVTSASATAITAANTGTVLQAVIRGTLRVNGGGTVIPQLTQVTASAAAAVAVNSQFRCWPKGGSSVTAVGNWS